MDAHDHSNVGQCLVRAPVVVLNHLLTVADRLSGLVGLLGLVHGQDGGNDGGVWALLGDPGGKGGDGLIRAGLVVGSEPGGPADGPILPATCGLVA